MNEGLSGWQKCKLGELTEIVTKGTTPSTLGEGFTEYGVNFIKSEAVGYDGRIDRSTFVFISPEMHEKLKRSQLKENDILFSMAGVFLGKNAMVLDDMLPANTNQALAIIRINQKKALPKFIHYFFRNPCTIEFVNNISGQSAQPNINFQEIKSIEINLPEIPEQKAIAAVLSSLDDKIDLLHRQNKTLESMAETLFRHWFIEEAQDDWGEYSVSDFADHFKENVVPAKSKSEYYHHYSLPAFDDGKRPNLELGSEILSNKYKVVEHSILVSKLNPKVPRIWPVSSLPSKNSICSTEFQVLKPKNIKLYGYLLFLLRSNDAVDALSMAASGTSGSHQRVRPEDIFNIKTILPSLASAEQYSDMVIPGIAKTSSNLSQIETLEKIRDTLLPKLMSGEVRVEV